MTDRAQVLGSLEQAVERYAFDVGRFAREVFDFKPYRWQQHDLFDPYDARDRLIAIKSGHGVGKSAGLSIVMAHHQLFFYPQKTIVTAPAATQLWDALWAEFRSKIQALPEHWKVLLEVKSDRVVLAAAPDDSFTSARTSRAESPEAMAGVHAPGTPGAGVLLIADEASGIPEQVFEAAAGSMSGHNAMTILTGNPVRTTGYFHQAFTDLADLFTHATVSCLDVPEAVDIKAFEQQIARTYGRNSNQYRVRVLGEFPTTEADTVIPYELVEAALNRDTGVSKGQPVVWGVDCARFGDDRSTLAKRRGRELLGKIIYWTKLDTMELAARIHAEYHRTPLDDRPVDINVDAINMGAGVVDRLRQLGLPARDINVSEMPSFSNTELYRDLKAELWFKAREWFEHKDCTIPKYYETPAAEEDFVRELTVQKYDYSPQTSKIFIVSKKDMKKLYGVNSPDLAEAFIMTFASDASRLIHGKLGVTSWNRKISRPLKGLV